MLIVRMVPPWPTVPPRPYRRQRDRAPLLAARAVGGRSSDRAPPPSEATAARRASEGARSLSPPGPATVAAAIALYLVRHAHAGRRRGWDGPDDQRPLSSKGEKEALGLADRLESKGITHLVSSPAVRCVQSLEPLAERLGLPIAVDHRIAEGTDA